MALSLYKLINKVFAGLMTSIIAFQAILLMFSVFFRYVLNSPILWADEITRYSLVWITFAGAALATKEGRHIGVDVLDQVLPPLGKKITDWFVDIVVIGFMFFMIYYGIRMTNYQRSSFGETLNWFSYAYVYVAVPIGAVLVIFYTISKYFITEEKATNEND